MAGIIKSGEYHDGPRSTNSSAFNLEDMSRQAENYLQAVQQRAAQILATAKAQADAVAETARDRGRQTALRDAEFIANSKLERQMKSFVPALTKTVEAIQHSRQSWLKHWEEQTVHLAVAIAERVIRGELTRRPEISLEWVREALELATGQGRIAVHLHPQDCEALGQQTQMLVDQLAPLGTGRVVSDPTVEVGGCKLVTEFGCVDQQISSQLNRIEKELAG
jgi:flagellar biosynthesis/type III secretory pathway protein FliH